MTRYQQINHSRDGQPKVFAFGINWAIREPEPLAPAPA